MAHEVTARRVSRLSVVDAFLWLVRIVAVLIILWGSFVTLSDPESSIRSSWGDFIVFGIAQGSVYGLIALGYTMVYGVLRFINFAHGEVFMVGAMVGFQVADGLSRTALWGGSELLALAVVLLTCIAASTAVAVLLERVAYRPLRGTPRLIPLITAIGASFFLQYAIAGIFGTDNHNFPVVESLSGFYVIAGIEMLKPQAMIIGTALVMMAVLYGFIEFTKTGRAIRAVSEDQETAQLMGINVDRTISMVFAVGGAMAGVAAFLYGLNFGQANFTSGFLIGIKAFTAAVLGGIGNIPGAMLGGLTLGIVESVGPSLVLEGLPTLTATHQLKDVIAFLTLILVLIFRPSGILGERLAEERG